MSAQAHGFYGALYINPADLTKLSPSRIQVLEEQGRARIVAENEAKETEQEAHMEQKYGESFDWRKDRRRYNRFMDSTWEKLHKMRRPKGEKSPGSANGL